MGGKNAVIVDVDADLDQAVPAVVASAFGFAGQKCSAASRLVVVGAAYDEVVARVAGATRELRVGHPSSMGVQVGPVIDDDAFTRIAGYVERAPRQGSVVAGGGDVPTDGWYVAPTVVSD